MSLNQFIITCIAEQVGELAKPVYTQVHSAHVVANLQVSFDARATIGFPMGMGSAPQQRALTAYTGDSLRLPIPAEKIYARN